MKKLLKKAMAYQRRESRRFKDGIEVIQQGNRKILCALLWIGCISLILFSIIAALVKPCRILLPACGMVLAFYGLLALAVKFFPRLPPLPLLYLEYGALLALAFYSSVFLMPNSPSTLLLVLLLLMPSLILDKSWRLIVLELLCATGYLYYVIPRKAAELMLSETLYCLLFTAIALILGQYVRQAQIENQALRRQAVVHGKTDFLTGLGNRRGLYERMAALRGEDSSTYGVLMIDVDYFKRYNDTYGPQGGDECLQKLSSLFRLFGSQCNVSFFRYEGEKFIGVTTGYSSQQLLECGTQLGIAVADLRIPHVSGLMPYVTVSIGTAAGPSGLELNGPLLKQADAALRMAKKRGRNQAAAYVGGMEIPYTSES